MDGAVPQIYIGLVVGVFISLSLSIMQLWLSWKGGDTNKKLIISKRNLICSGTLFIITVYFSGTIIGYGPLVYIVPIQLLIVLIVYIKLGWKNK